MVLIPSSPAYILIVGFASDYSQNFRYPVLRGARGASEQQAFAALV